MAVLINNGKGVIKIPNSVIGEVAYSAAKECGGVAEVITDGAKSKKGSRGVRVSSKNGEISLSFGIVMEYGASVSGITAELSHVIPERVLEFTGVENLKLNINVESIRF